MVLDAILAILQVNIALGILYWALQAARYRDKLFEPLSRLVPDVAERDGNEEAKPLGSGLFGVAAIKDDEFPKTYYRVAKWRRLMPEKYDGDLKGTNAGLFTREPGQPGTPSKLWGTLKNWRTRMPLSYRWFRSNLDKYTVFTLNTMVPIVLMWLVVRAPDDQTYWGYFYAVILFEQVWVASNVLLGIHMFQRHSRSFAVIWQCHAGDSGSESNARREQTFGRQQVVDLPH